jgi:resuscitation-promoting factor RpfA
VADEGRQPVAIRIARPYQSEDEFLEHELEMLTRTSVVLLGAQARPQGVVLRFELTLASGAPLLRGEGRVVGFKPNANGDEPGLTLRFTRLDPRSKALVDRAAAVRDARARAAASRSWRAPAEPEHDEAHAALGPMSAGSPGSMRESQRPPPIAPPPLVPSRFGDESPSRTRPLAHDDVAHLRAEPLVPRDADPTPEPAQATLRHGSFGPPASFPPPPIPPPPIAPPAARFAVTVPRPPDASSGPSTASADGEPPSSGPPPTTAPYPGAEPSPPTIPSAIPPSAAGSGDSPTTGSDGAPPTTLAGPADRDALLERLRARARALPAERAGGILRGRRA